MPTTVRPPRRVPAVTDLVATGRAAGLDAVGVTAATPFATTRRHLADRAATGLHGGMRFTYLHPERSSDPTTAVPGARSLVVGARRYHDAGPGDVPPVGEGAPHGGGGLSSGGGAARAATDGGGLPAPVAGATRGRVARYARADHYGALREALAAVARELSAAGWRARVLSDDNALVDREAAFRAGLGWYGKNANLLLPGQGSWFVLGAVVTDAPLAGRSPARPVGDGCGSCTRCIGGCPTGAIVAPGVVDARRCLAWLLQVDGPFPLEHRAALGDRLYGCDDCQEVCPPNRRPRDAGSVPPGGTPSDADPGATVDVLDLLAAPDDELMARHGRWYVPRRQARYLRRNALVVLGNVARPADARVVAALRSALAHDDPLVRAHAVWAARRLGRDDLVAAAGSAQDPSPLVGAEVAAAVAPRSADRSAPRGSPGTRAEGRDRPSPGTGRAELSRGPWCRTSW
ncbi:MAG TPA: 4Fe-4S double cluster binding domain-containing protein [Acidimicrobiales bacterium]|nr:4Fe-4S double cluster binding domain-containing protein [Acidimicrobiales bacterium]